MEISKLFAEHPELFLITKHRIQNGIICYSESLFQKNTLIDSLVWIYQNYFCKETIVFLPKMFSVQGGLTADLATLEHTNIKTGSVVIFGYADFIFQNLVGIDKRKTNTILKNILKKATIIVLSSCSLKILNLPILDIGTTKDSFEYTQLDSPLINYRTVMDYISFFDLDPDDLDTFTEMVSSMVTGGKRIYVSLNLLPKKLMEIESKLKDLGHSILRKDSMDCDIVMNSWNLCKKKFLLGNYDIYIFSPSSINNDIEVVNLLKNVLGNREVEVYLDSDCNIDNCLKNIYTTSHIPRISIKDSPEFESYKDLINSFKIELDVTIMSEDYYTLYGSPEIQQLDLLNLSRQDFDTIRNYVKLIMLKDHDLELKTIQLVTPSSPKNRYNNINSLAIKLGSWDYRCQANIEIFENYTIGVVTWNETVSDRKTMELKLSEGVYVYQTTSGKWKYTTIK
jgi:hypothetical protein